MPDMIDGGGGGGSTTGTSSANPDRLVQASQAVPEDIEARLSASVQQALSDAIVSFNGSPQEPELLTIDAGAHVEPFGAVVGDGEAIDSDLVRVASGFYAIGEPMMGPQQHGGPWPWVVNDADMDGHLAGWEQPPPVEFRIGDDGQRQVLGPDGQWYTLADPNASMEGLVPLGTNQDTVDLGYGDFAVVVAAGGTLLGGARSMGNHAPPWAYDQIVMDPNGAPIVVATDVDPASLPPRHRMHGGGGHGPMPPLPHNYERGFLGRREAPSAAYLAQGALAGVGEFADAKYTNVYDVQPTYYLDPATGERVATVDAAHMTTTDDGEVIVSYGTLWFDDEQERIHILGPCDGVDERGRRIGYTTPTLHFRPEDD
jgi:hypothetical protein